MNAPRARHPLDTLRISLVLVWLVTALVSVLEWSGQSTDLLRQAGLHNGLLINTSIAAGVVVDALLGLLLWLRPRRQTYALAMIGMLLMTTIATLLLPSLWLHPLGPLLKNLPIAAALWQLWKSSP